MSKHHPLTYYATKNVPFLTSCRVAIAFCNMVGYLFMYVLRFDLSMAIVCMVKAPAQNASLLPARNASWESGNASWGGGDGAREEAGDCGELETRTVEQQGEFEWSRGLTGWVLSSFFYGYIVTQILGGRLALKVGGKMVYGVGMLISIICTVLVPEGARLSPYVLIVLRVIQGLAMGVMFPASHTLWGKWAPPLERSKLVAFSYAGTMMGTIVAMGLSGFLCAISLDNGWPFIFYVYGGACFLWFIWWNLVVFDSPQQHPRISDAERRYIHDSIGASVYTKSVSVPWVKMFRSPAVWAIIVSHMGNNWGSYTILSCIPMYMKEVLKFDIKSNGMLSAVPYICMFVTTNIWSNVTDCIRKQGCLSTGTMRKLNQGIANLGATVFLVLVGYMQCHQRWLAVTFLTLAVTCTSACRAGYNVNHIDIAPKYAGILFGISNTAATIPGMVAPYVAAALTPNGSQSEWQVVFFICAAVYLASFIFYAVFAQGEEQEWSKEDGGVVDEKNIPLQDPEELAPVKM